MIHATAVIEPGAELGENVTIGPMAYIAANVRIERDCVIGPHAVILDYTSLGEGCRVHAHAVLGDFPQDTAFVNAPSFLKIGSQCIIREGVTMHRGTKPESVTEVGPGCFLMANSHLAHNVKLGAGVVIANGALLAGYVEVGERAFISGNCLLHQFIRVGRVAMLSGGCALNKDVPPFCMTLGARSNQLAGLNVVGLRRAGFNPGQRLELKRAFGILFKSGLNMSQALEALRRELPEGAARELAEFITGSKRGVCRWGSHRGDAGGDE
ncbi:MAG: acyl-ACP--UDP-N-acetylglucosamine O-acyltransferase [Kiritimatiellia bacterium]